MSEAEQADGTAEQDEQPADDGGGGGDEPTGQPVKQSEGGCNACDLPEDDLLVVYDRNLDYPWKGGNPYARVCPDCNSRTFTAKSYWQSQEEKYVIPKGEDEPVLLFACPYDDCDGELLGQVDACPECEREILWEGSEDDEAG